MKKAEETRNDALEVTCWEVTRAHEFKDGNVSFDMMLNGIQLYGLQLVWYKKETRYFIGFPSKKVNDRYFNHYWFRSSDEFMLQILDAVEKKLKEGE